MAEPWHNAPSIEALRREANQRWPRRKTHLDGTVGDAAHAARESDHNPDAQGTVHAIDITHDPDTGPDCEKLAAFLVLRRDQRIKYIIWDGRWIKSEDWTWVPYTGESPHSHHLHVSIKSTAAAEKDTTPWLDINPVEWALVLLEVEKRRADKRAGEEARKRELAFLETLAALHPLQQHAPAASGSSLQAILSGVMSSVAAVTMPLAVGYTVQPEPPKMRIPSPPPGYSRVRGKVPIPVVQEANRLKPLLRSDANAAGLPVGSYLVRHFGGKDFVLLVEWHQHQAHENVSDALKRPHRGFSIFAKAP